MIRQGNRVLVPAGRPSARLARDAATDAARRAVAQQQTRQHHPDFTQTRGWKAIQAEKLLPKDGLNAEIARGLELGLPGASSIEDRTIPTFSRGELPHFAGINTFMVRAPPSPPSPPPSIPHSPQPSGAATAHLSRVAPPPEWCGRRLLTSGFLFDFLSARRRKRPTSRTPASSGTTTPR